MTTHSDILAMIQAITSRPTPETLTQIVEVMEALHSEIGSLERQVRSQKLQARAGKVFSGQKRRNGVTERYRIGWGAVTGTPKNLSAVGGKSVP